MSFDISERRREGIPAGMRARVDSRTSGGPVHAVPAGRQCRIIGDMGPRVPLAGSAGASRVRSTRGNSHIAPVGGERSPG